MRGRPPKRKFTDEEKRKADAFVGGAAAEPDDRERNREGGSEELSTRNISAEEHDQPYPWEEDHVREDVKQAYALRLPEPLYLKLKYVSSQTGESMNQLINDAVSELVSRELPSLT